MNPDPTNQLREEIDSILKQLDPECGSSFSAHVPVIHRLLALIERERRKAVEEFTNRVMLLEPRVLRDIESSHMDEGGRLYARLMTVFLDMFELPPKLSEEGLTTAEKLFPDKP